MHTLSRTPVQIFLQAVSLHDRGRLREAEQLYQTVLIGNDRHFDSLYRLGLLRLQQRRFLDAEHFFRRAMNADKRSADAHHYLGFALTGLGRNKDAVPSYEKAIAIRPNFPEAYNNLGYALQLLGRLNDAIAQYEKAIDLRPNYHEAYNNLGNAFHILDRSEEAIPHYEKALAIKPDYAEAEWNFGTSLRALGRFEEAITHYEKAIAIWPDYYEAYNSLGNALRSLGRIEEAIVRYEKAFAIRPDYIEAQINRGDALDELHRDEEAIAAYDSALAINPKNSHGLMRRGEALLRLNRADEALASFDAAIAADANDDAAFSALVKAATVTCNWQRLTPLLREVPARAGAGHFFNPFTFLSLSGDPALQLACATRFLGDRYKLSKHVWTGETWRNRKIKVAYVSGDFRINPVGFLIAELIELHDRSRFEIIGISCGPDDRSDIRARLVRAFDDRFYDVRGKADRDIAKFLNDLKVDIAVDCSGYTTHSRTGVFAARPAPIQVNYIGFPGPLGTNFYDYILADATVLPFDQQPFYTEKIVHLPDAYLATDSKHPVADRTPTREQVGLPAQGFVFCSFNRCHKIRPPVFDVWMRLLKHVEGSVLWVLRDRDAAELNLRREAVNRGVDPARLIFTRQVPDAEYMPRHRLADLFLDTLPYNAHTTAANALLVGLPVVTCLGQSFAGRVAASLLRAVGMPDLVTGDLEAYERLALRIASEPLLLQELRERLQRNRLSYPLFNGDRYRRHVESAYLQMWECWQRGENPESFSVEPEFDKFAPKLNVLT